MIQIKKIFITLLSIVFIVGFLVNTKISNNSQIYNTNSLSNCHLLSLHPFVSPPSTIFVQKMEQWQTKKNAVILLYATTFDSDLPYIIDNLNAIWNNGNVPLLSLEFYTEDSVNTDIETRIANGYKDNYFGLLNQRLKVFLDGPDGITNTDDDRRVYIRPAHEANGNWYPWSGNTADYITAWRRMYGIVNTNITKNQMQWIWNVNNTDVQFTAEQYYPGDLYVDWLGVDGYNWGTSQSWSIPQTPNQVFGGMVQRLRNINPNKPISINEVATTTAGSDTTSKNLWIKQMFEYTATNNIKMLSWFNEDKETDWGIYGGSGGDEINQGYKAYSQYRIETAKSNVIGSNPANTKHITDLQFIGSEDCQNNCPTGFYFANSNCFYLQKAGIEYKEFITNPTTNTGSWQTQYKTNNGSSYNTFKCDDIKDLVGANHLNFDNKNYLGIKETCNKTKQDAITSGVTNPRIFFYGFIYKQVNTRTNVTKYYSFVYTSYFDANGNFVNWYSQLKKDNPSSTGYIIYDAGFNKIG